MSSVIPAVIANTPPVSGAAPFVPTEISGMQLWLDAADTSSLLLNTENRVQTWNDKSGNLRHVSQATVANRPTYNAASRGVVFSGAQPLEGTVMPIQQSGTLFTVASTTSTRGRLIDIKNGAMQVITEYGTGAFAFFYNSTSQYNGRATGGSTDTMMMVNARNGAEAPDYAWNGATPASYIVLGSETSATRIRVGGEAGVTLNGVANEILFFDSYLTTEQRQRVEGYLAWKWGLITELPSNHPFKNAAPLATPVSSFAPTEIEGVQLWLDSSDSLTRVGQEVRSMQDKSGNEYHMNTLTRNITNPAPGGTAIFPVVGTPMNSLNTTSFSAFAGLQQSTTINNIKSFFWIGRQKSQIGECFLFGHSDDNIYDFHGTSTRFIDINGQLGLRQASARLFGSSVQTGQWSSFGLPSVDTNFLLSVDGITGNTRFQGLCFDRGAHPGWIGDVGEVLVYSTVLTTTERERIEGYLAWKWGLQSQLPTAHPFKSAAPTGAASVPSTVVTFAYTGADQSFLVPTGVTSVKVSMWGAGGGGADNTGGAGAYVEGTLAVTPEETLTVVVGQRGINGAGSLPATYGGGGGVRFNYYSGTIGSGGGRSAICRGSQSVQANNIVVAGGGGGGGQVKTGLRGGAAQWTGNGLDGNPPDTHNGRGGLSTGVGGAGGTGGVDNGGNGVGVTGGIGGMYAAGGGGGWGGGGGGGISEGRTGGGGGGSSRTDQLTSATGQNSSNGVQAPNQTSPFWSSPVGAGGEVNGAGGHGLVVIEYVSTAPATRRILERSGLLTAAFELLPSTTNITTLEGWTGSSVTSGGTGLGSNRAGGTLRPSASPGYWYGFWHDGTYALVVRMRFLIQPEGVNVRWENAGFRQTATQMTDVGSSNDSFYSGGFTGMPLGQYNISAFSFNVPIG